MNATTITAPSPTGTPAPARALRIGRREYPLLLPSLRDPRLHTAAFIVSVQILGQTSLGFELSIAQILLSLLTSAVLEVAIMFVQRRVVMWPAERAADGQRRRAHPARPGHRAR